MNIYSVSSYKTIIVNPDPQKLKIPLPLVIDCIPLLFWLSFRIPLYKIVESLILPNLGETSNTIHRQHTKPDVLLFFQAPSIDDKVDLHFVALVHKDGNLYELGKNHGLMKFNLACKILTVTC